MSYDQSPAEYAGQAAEAVRALNHVTLFPDTYGWPADVDAVIGHLQMTAMRCQQALDQAAGWLMQSHAAGRVGHDQGADAGAAVRAAAEGIDRAGRYSERLAEELNAVRKVTAHLTGTDT